MMVEQEPKDNAPHRAPIRRRRARELAFALVFEWSFHSDAGVDVLWEDVKNSIDGEKCAFAVGLQSAEHDFALLLARGAETHVVELDELIGEHARNWRRERISRVAMAVMRVAVFEMRYMEEDGVNVEIAINEAVELAKIYGGDEDGQFVNGVLGGVARAGGD